MKIPWETALPGNLFIMLGITLGGIILYQLLFLLLKHWAKSKKRFIPHLLQHFIYAPGFMLIMMLSLLIALPYLRSYFHPKIFKVFHHVLIILTIVSVGWLFINCATVLRELLFSVYKNKVREEYSIRKANTKFQLIQRVLNFMVVLTTIALILMTFKGVKQLGSSLLASAGVVGLILGFAAQKSLGTIFAGIQIAVAQPIRLDDVVIFDGKFGRIGEINLTYVVVNVWDGSRLIVPINHFLEKSVETWTRVSSEIISKVRIHADYTLPVDEIRSQFMKWMSESPLWDKRTASLVVTAAHERTIEVRATMSARNSDDSYQLECMIRERLIHHIRTYYPESLPRTRVINDSAHKDKNAN